MEHHTNRRLRTIADHYPIEKTFESNSGDLYRWHIDIESGDFLLEFPGGQIVHDNLHDLVKRDYIYTFPLEGQLWYWMSKVLEDLDYR